MNAVEIQRWGPWRVEVARFLELVGVFGLAIAQPTFDLLGKNASLFVAWNATTPRALFLVAAVILVPAVTAYLVEAIVGLMAPRARSFAHGLLLAFGVGVIVSEAVKHATTLSAGVLIALGIAGALIAAVIILRWEVVRTWLRYLSIAPVGFAALLLLGSPASTVVFGSEPAMAAVTVHHPHRVVMIVMDEFPLTSLLDGRGAIDAQLYPNFAALSHSGTWYRNDTTVAPYTEAAVPAILTGQLPQPSEKVPVAAEHPHNLFTLLGKTYALNVHESVTRLCPRTACLAHNRAIGVHPGVRGMVQDAASIWGDFADPGNRDAPGFGGLGGEDTQAVLTANGFVNTLRPSTQPTFDFLHVLLPHFPWHYLPTGQDYAALPGHTNGLHGQNWANAQVAALSRVRHLLQVQATDTFIGQVVARLKLLGVYDDTLLVVTADHGVAFQGGGPIRGVTTSNIPDIAWTPLFIKAPGQRVGGADDRATESIDIVPTMAQHLGVTIPWTVDGRTLLGAPRTSPRFPLFEWSRSVLRPPPGQHFLRLDRASGFAAVRRAQAAPPNEFADLRVFRVGRYANLLGTIAHPDAVTAHATATLDSPLRYLLVDQASPKAQYAAIHGMTSLKNAGQPLAVVVNGVVAGLSFTYRSPGSDHTEFWGTLVPRFFHNGRNFVQTYTVDGPSDAPVLHLLTPA
jgi:Arylsulfatase A and related enzymes